MTAFLLFLLIAQSGPTPPGWTLDVRHDHMFGACAGQLLISEDSIRYETSNEDHAREWKYSEVESFEIVSANEIRIHTYESDGILKLWGDRAFAFRLADDSLDGDVYAYLEARSPRPIRTRIIPGNTSDTDSSSGTFAAAADQVVQEFPVRHDHLFGGCQGIIDVTENRIIYVTDNPNDSRIWRLADVESFASTNEFDLRISTREETFHFDLKIPLNRDTYQHIWNKVYEPQIQTYRGSVQMKRILLKAAVVAVVAVAVGSVYLYRDIYRQYLSRDAASEPGVPADAGMRDSTPQGTREDPYVGQGVIRDIQIDDRQLAIAHEQIPGLMGAMTMTFPVSEDVELEAFTVGDGIEFRIETLDATNPGENTIQVFALSGGATPGAVPSPNQDQAMFTVDSTRQQLIGVRTSPVRYETFDRTMRTIGTVALDETRMSEVHPKVAGWIEESFVDFQYQHVQNGDALFTLYSPELVATQEEYLLALRGLETLGESRFPSVALGAQDLVQAARRRLELWDITPEQIEQLEEAREPFRTMTIYSPVTGHVMTRNAFPGQHVTPETKLYEIADHSVVWVKADVYENDIAWVRTGQRAVMRVQALPGREFAGRVTFIDPHVNERTRTLTVRVEFANADLTLKPGMYADVELRASMGRRLMVPESAVLPTGLRNIVFVDRGEGRMEIRNVQLGAKVSDHVEILGGLVEGELVVISGNFLIDAESKLQAAEPVWQGENPQ